MPYFDVSDCVFSLQPHEWKAIVSGRIHGPFNSRGAAEAGMEVEQRREAARKATAYLSLPTNAPIETVLDTLAAPATDMRYPMGDWMYEVGEGDTVLGYEEWRHHKREADAHDAREAEQGRELASGKFNDYDDPNGSIARQQERERMTAYHADALNKAMGVITSHNATAQAPVVPAETAPLYMAALNSFWLTVHSVYPNAEKVTMPQAIAQAFEVAAAGVVEAWMSAYDAGGYSDVNFGG